MIALPDSLRHVVAAGAAAAGFLGLFFGAALVWWAALGGAVALYGALLLLIRRAAEAEEVMLSDRVSLADVRSAAGALNEASRRLDKASESAGDHAPALTEMAAHLLSIKDQIQNDPQDFREARRFIVSYLPRIVESTEAYVALAERAGPKDRARVEDLGARIARFAPVVEEIDRACLANDFDALEVQVDVLASQIERR